MLNSFIIIMDFLRILSTTKGSLPSLEKYLCDFFCAIIKDKWAAEGETEREKRETRLAVSELVALSTKRKRGRGKGMGVYRAKSVCIVFLLKAANILCISAVMKRSKREEERGGRGGGRDVVDLQGNGYFSKLLIISFLCPLNEGYKVNTLYNKAPADASFAHFQRLHCLLGFYLA